jgi:hypothetical protein
MNNSFKDVVTGIKLAIKLRGLAESVNFYHIYPFLRIIQVISGVSIILFLSTPSLIENFYLH